MNSKTVTKFLTDDQLARYQPWFDNARRLKELIAMLQTASVHAVEQHEGCRCSDGGLGSEVALDR